jgi:iron complex outermembrane receptor protein
MNTPIRRPLASTLLTAVGAYALLAAIATPSLAQTDSTPTASASSDTLETVVVTARRRSESVQKTPVSVSAIPPSQLEGAAAPNIEDLESAAPNVVIDTVAAGPMAAAISIRGISFEDIEKSFDPAVGVLIDGVYLGTNTGQLLDFFDFASVEVLRGPQGTLFGRNTTAGVINIQRTRPTGMFGGKIQTVFGNYGRQEIRGVVNTALIQDRLALKVFGSSTANDGFYRNVTRSTREPEGKYQSYGATLLFTPNDAFDYSLTIEHQKDRGHTAAAPLSNSTDLICNAVVAGLFGAPVLPSNQCGRNNDKDMYTSFSNKTGAYSYDVDAVTGQGNWKLGKVSLASVTGFRRSKEDVNQDFDSTSINFFDTRRQQKYKQFSQELRASGDLTDQVNYVVGGYYFESSYDLNQTTNYGILFQGLIGAPARGFQTVHHKSKSTAIFADVDYKFAKDWRLSVGGRYTKDTKQIDNSFNVFNIKAKDSWSEFTPKVSIDYQVNDGVLAYASYSKGYRSGGFNGRGSTPASAALPYNPEKVQSYEAGIKTEWLDNRLILNLAAFETKYDDKQEEVVRQVPVFGQETVVVNAAAATIKGLELELVAAPTKGLTLYGNLGLLDASYDSFLSRSGANVIDVSGRNLRRTPKVTGAIGGDYKIDASYGKWVLSANYAYIAPYDTTINAEPGNLQKNDRRGRTDAQNNVDASITFIKDTDNGSLNASIYGRNLLDDRGLNSALPVAGLFTFGGARPPMTYGVRLGFEF